MIKNIRNSLVAVIVILTFYVSFSCVILNAVPSVENVTIQPENPAPSSTVTLTVTITDTNDIEGVWLIVKECDANTGVCFQKQNVSMTKIEGTDNYQKEVVLKHNDATYISYHLEIESNGEWFIEDSTDVNLEIKGDNGETNDTPGFVLVTLLATVSIGLLLFKRKRF